MSDSDSLISEADSEALIISDQDLYVEYVKSSSSKRKVASSNAESSDVTQEEINVKILSQLDKRLDSIETSVAKQCVGKPKSKKVKRKVYSSATVSPNSQALNVPELNVLRQDTSVQALVEQCIGQLADAEKTGIKVVSYPMGGWLSSHHEGGKNFSLRENMLDYLIFLFDDANDISWDAAKASHVVLLCRMEQGEIKDYSQTQKIDRIRRANAQRHNVHTSGGQNHKKSSQKQMKSTTCNYFNAGTCSHNKIHETRGILYKHVQHALPWTRLIAIQKLNVDPKIRKFKKTNTFG